MRCKHAEFVDGCRKCWLFANDERYRRLWGNLPQVSKDKKTKRPPCSHLGQQTGERECELCTGKVRLKVLACEVHGECTIGKKVDGLACCKHCPDHSEK